jgi:hypothetical protein
LRRGADGRLRPAHDEDVQVGLGDDLAGWAVAAMGNLGNSADWAITMGCCIAMSSVWGDCQR